MTDKKGLVENHFDAVIGGTAQREYRFEDGGSGSKDRQIMKALRRYGIAGKKCLDIGPGTARWLSFLQKEGAASLSAVDISDVVLERAAPYCNNTQKVDLERDPLRFGDNSFDIILSIEVLEHLRDPALYLAEIVRVARPGAGVIMSVPNVASLAGRIRMLFGFLPAAIAADRTHVAFYRPKDLKVLLARYGQTPTFLPTSVSLSLINTKSRFRLPSNRLMNSLNDSLLFTFSVNKRSN